MHYGYLLYCQTVIFHKVMKLEQFRTAKKLSFGGLAKLLGLEGDSAATTVWRWCKGNRTPKPEYISKIYKITQGKVQPNDFYETKV